MNRWLSSSLESTAMEEKTSSLASLLRRKSCAVLAVLAMILMSASTLFAKPAGEGGGEAALKLPDLRSVSFFNNAIDGHHLLLIGILFCIFGLLFGLVIYMQPEEPAGASRHARDLRADL